MKRLSKEPEDEYRLGEVPCKCENNIKMDFKERVWDVVDLIL
jgi:hypothetical protein